MNEMFELAKRFRNEVLSPMKDVLVGKDEIIEIMGIALVAGENLFLLGPPGTAKSALVVELSRRLSGRAFDYLLTRFTEPSELFGPFDIRRLRDGDLITNTEGMLPEADFVFLDELLNANSAILNSLLMALNERVFRRGRETVPLPLLMVVAASNRLPEDEALGALFDRFLLRVRCENVDDEHLPDVLRAGWRREKMMTEGASVLDPDEIRKLQSSLREIDLSMAMDAYVDLVTRLRTAGFAISDRRAVKLQRVVAASALLSGRADAIVSDLWVLRYIWDTIPQQETLIAHVDAVINEAVDPDKEADAHPLSVSNNVPDPEAIAADLTRLEGMLSDAQDAAAKSVVADQITRLNERVQWVKNQTAREQLSQRADKLLSSCK